MEAVGANSIVARSLIAPKILTPRAAQRRAISPQFSHALSWRRKLAATKDCAGEVGLARIENYGREWSNVVCASLSTFLLNVDSVYALSDDNVVESATEAATKSLSSAVEGVTSLTDSLSAPLPEVDTSSLIDLVSSNALVLVVAGAVLALPFVLFSVLNKSSGYGVVSAKDAYAQLGNEELVSQVLDIRSGDDIKSEGVPNLKAFRKRVTQLPYTDEPEEYLAKVLKLLKNAETTTVFVLDRFDGNSSTVAKLLVKGGFKAAYAIKDGAEGPSGWQKSDLPWLIPSKVFSINLGNLKELLSTKDTGNVLPTTLGVAAAAGVGLVVFSEAETALQLLGSAALIQVFIKKFLFAKDRERTIKELQTFLDTKIAPKELVDELKGIVRTVLPKSDGVEPLSTNSSPSIQNASEQNSTPVGNVPASSDSELVSSPVLETTAGELQVKDKAETSNSSTDLPSSASPLSPYPQYPGLKPPTSPTPARP